MIYSKINKGGDSMDERACETQAWLLRVFS